MSQLNLKGKIKHANGSVAKFASVTIIDKDAGGNGDDVIFNGNTNANGEFSGTSSEWKDLNTVKGAFNTNVPVPDILSLEARIKQGNKEITLPYFKLDVLPPGFSNSIDVSSPLVVPWLPPPEVIGKVNGTPYTDPIQLNFAVKTAVDNGVSPIVIETYGPDAGFFEPLTKSKSELEKWVKNSLQVSALTGTEIFWILIAIAIIIAAVGVTFVCICVGLAILYAIHKGYKNVKSEQGFDTQFGQMKNTTTISN